MHRFLAFLRPLRGGRTISYFCFFGRIKRSSKCCNFYIYYEVDDDEVPSVLSLDEYGSEDEGGWLLLEAVGATV